jgi:hypothetical protein
MAVTEYRLTTKDNPFDPFDEFEQWYNYDCNVLGLNSCAYLARLAATSEYLSDEENIQATNEAIDLIIASDPFDLYRRVTRKN